jgi:xanthine dehydrogenase accessory factor
MSVSLDRLSSGAPIIVVRSAGEQGTGVLHKLHACGFRCIALDAPRPTTVRTTVAFSTAISAASYTQTVEGVKARYCHIGEGETLPPDAPAAAILAELEDCWSHSVIPILVDPEMTVLTRGIIRPAVVVDAILSKKPHCNGLHMGLAPLVIALGPPFEAGRHCHVVVETCRGHDLGRLIFEGQALPNTHAPGDICGFTTERVLRAPCAGMQNAQKQIGDLVQKGDVVALVGDQPVIAQIDGVVRGMLRTGTSVPKAGFKVGDVDPRGDVAYALRISDKARAIGLAVLEAVVRWQNGCVPLPSFVQRHVNADA